jgi:hypothetical protein
MTSSRWIANGWHRLCIKSLVTFLNNCRESGLGSRYLCIQGKHPHIIACTCRGRFLVLNSIILRRGVVTSNIDMLLLLIKDKRRLHQLFYPDPKCPTFLIHTMSRHIGTSDCPMSSYHKLCLQRRVLYHLISLPHRIIKP